MAITPHTRDGHVEVTGGRICYRIVGDHHAPAVQRRPGRRCPHEEPVDEQHQRGQRTLGHPEL
jgi:hypothetical protein